MADKPKRIWAFLGGPMVGLFVSGGNTAYGVEYVHINELTALHDRAFEAEAEVARLTCLVQAYEEMAEAARKPGAMRRKMARRREILDLKSEIKKLADLLLVVETLTSTGEGLAADEAIAIHAICAEGRSDDPHAWRAHPDFIKALRDVVARFQAT